MQRRPSPKMTGAIRALPCRKMLSATGFSPDEVSTSVSEERFELPEAESSAPPVLDEFSQPWPASPLFPHGQGDPVPSPKQEATIGGCPRSRTKTSSAPFVSLATRFEAELWNATKRPSAEIEGFRLKPLPSAPPVAKLTRSVVPLWRSRRKTPSATFVSPATRFGAALQNATRRPAAEIEVF